MIRMELVGVRVEVPANTPLVMLREHTGRHRLLPILIGSAEASSIHAAMEGIVPPRPLTHDLVVSMLETLNVQLARVVITEIRDHTYYAELHLNRGDDTLVVSSRPSDALALAVRTGTEIFASSALLDQVAIEAPEEIAEREQDELLGEFREFLDDISPEDFGA